MLYQSCCNNLVTGLIVPSSLLQFVNSLFQTCSNKFGTSSAITSCQQLVNRLVTNCLQVCSNLCVFTCVYGGGGVIYQSFIRDFLCPLTFSKYQGEACRYTNSNGGGHDLLPQDFKIFITKCKANSCHDWPAWSALLGGGLGECSRAKRARGIMTGIKKPNIRGNKTTNEEVKYVCC